MSFLTPLVAGIAAAIAIPSLVLLYFLKLKRRDMAISSTLLWKKSIQDMQVNSPFQKLKRNLLLLIQLLLLIALLIALARPTILSSATPGERVVILIDHSASMNATDVAGGLAGGLTGTVTSNTRLDEAKRQALSLLDSIDAGGDAEGAMVISFAEQASVLQPFTGDLARLRSAIRQLEPTDQLSNLPAALRLVEPFALEAGGENGLTVYIISDGRVQLPQGERLVLANADVRYLKVGANDPTQVDNVGLVGFGARRDFERPHLVQVFGRVANFSAEPKTVSVFLRLDDNLAQVQTVNLPAAPSITVDAAGLPVVPPPSSRSVQFEFPLPGSGLVELSHDQEDQLEADNKVSLTLAPARRLRVLLVTTGNPFLERVIEAVGVRDLAIMPPSKFELESPESLQRSTWDDASDEGFDLIVFDGYSPTARPLVSGLYFGAQPPIEGLAITPPREDDPNAQAILDWLRDDPIMRYVVLDDVVLSKPGRLVLPTSSTVRSRVLATGQTGPIMAEVAAGGYRDVVVSFDVLQSNWPLFVGFPVFMSNVMQQLGLNGLTEDAGISYRTGQVAALPLTNAEQLDGLSYDGPERLQTRAISGQALLPMFQRVGVYQAAAEVQPPFNSLSVNLASPEESDIRPIEKIDIGTSAQQVVVEDTQIRKEIWPWFAWAAFALLLIEWMYYTNRVRL